MGSPQSTQRFTEYFFSEPQIPQIRTDSYELLAISSVLLCVLRGAIS